MTNYRVGIIGTGRPWKSAGASGFGMSNAHALGYRQSPDATIVALADINLDNARAFQAEHGGDNLYSDYHEMLTKENLDIVSISTWPHLHAPMVIAAAEAGVKAIHCEKPMAPTFGEARRMVAVCEEHSVQLTFNHQRRFGARFRKARDLLRSGVIGDLRRVEGGCDNLFDWGTHWFDMFFFYNDETPAEWVIGQIDINGGPTAFGVPLEGQGLSHFKFKNDVRGLLITGYQAEPGAYNRLIGSEGIIEVQLGSATPLRYMGNDHTGWQEVDVGESENELDDVVPRGILDLIDALKTGREPELSAKRALRGTELIFATYESSRRRGRVDLPLAIEDSPLQAMRGEA